MAFYIKLNNGQEFTWNLPAKKPTIPGFKPESHRRVISYLQADGDELYHIRIAFANLPDHIGNIVKYPGELAEFIFINL